MSDLPKHRFALAGGWSMWRWLRLRGAGFPATTALELSSPSSARAADRWIELVRAAAVTTDTAVAAVEQQLSRASGQERRDLGHLLKRLRAGRPVSDEEATGPLAATLGARVEAERRAASAEADLHAVLDAERVRVSGVLRGVARSPDFREALTWQNRAALRTGVDALLRQPDGAHDKESRKREELIASYLQRYCLKNDTIGFFGPVGWGTFVPVGETVDLRAGSTLLATRTTYFEHWGIDALASQLGQDSELKPYLAPRRLPTVRIEGTTLHRPIERTATLPRPHAAVLAACDGERSARVIAAALLVDESLELDDEQAVFELLAELEESHLIVWTLEIPTADPRPERALRSALERCEGAAAATRALATLQRLEQQRDRVAVAAGDAVALGEALAELETTFTEITGQDGTRRAGQAYAGRTLVYEDCRRDVALAISPSVVERMGPPLSLLLASMRWYTFTVAALYRRRIGEIYREQRRQTGSPVVDWLRFREQLQALFPAGQHEKTVEVRQITLELQAKWARLLALAPSARSITVTVAELAGPVAEAFAAPHPGWPGARFHSPDVLVAAESLDHFRRGDYRIVLGELHAAANTLVTRMALLQHETPDALVHARELDLPLPAVAPVEAALHATRADHSSVSRHDLQVEIGATRSWRPRAQTIAIADLVVEEVSKGSLMVRTRDGSRRFDIIAFLEQELMYSTLGHFEIFPSLEHLPRVTIDGVIIGRERWSFAPEALAFAHAVRPVDRFAGARRFAGEHGLPELLFVKVPEETKPFYLDLASPIYVEIFCRIVRRASAVRMSEMLPSASELWLTDGQGRRYASELRMCAVDPEPWRAVRESSA